MDFSPDGSLFASLDADGSLIIWDCEENRITRKFVSDSHVKYTCFVWFTVCARNCPNTLDDFMLYIALGSCNGDVDLYSYPTGEIECELEGSGHDGSVTSICLHSNIALYTSGADGRIVEWSLSECREISSWSIGIVPTCIASLPHKNSLLVGRNELFLWSLENHKLQYKMAGHSTAVNSMKVLKQSDDIVEFVITTADSNREIFLWNFNTNENCTCPIATYLIEVAAVSVCFSVVDKGLMIAAVTDDDDTASGGVLNLFIVDDINKEHMEPVTIACNTHDVVPIPIVAATLKFGSTDSKNIQIACGRSPTLHFEELKYNPNEKKQTLWRADPRTLVNERQETTEEHLNATAPITVGNETHNRINMSLWTVEASHSRILSEIQAPRLVKLLKQALNNHNKNLLRTVFRNKDEKLIGSTLKRLPTQFIPCLIDEFTQMTEKKQANVQIVARWLSLLLRIHGNHLTGQGTNELSEKLSALQGIIEMRTGSIVLFLKLKGRLQLLSNQLKQNPNDDLTDQLELNKSDVNE